MIAQPRLSPTDGREFGLGDLNPSLFLSPSKPGEGGIIWGVGPTFLLPTATDKNLGDHKWGAGPSVVLLTIQGHWVVGVLANNIWSFASTGKGSNVSQMLVQPFVNYNLPHGWYLTSRSRRTGWLRAGNGPCPWAAAVGACSRSASCPSTCSLQPIIMSKRRKAGPNGRHALRSNFCSRDAKPYEPGSISRLLCVILSLMTDRDLGNHRWGAGSRRGPTAWTRRALEHTLFQLRAGSARLRTIFGERAIQLENLCRQSIQVGFLCEEEGEARPNEPT